MIIPILSALATSVSPGPEIEIRAMSFDVPTAQVFLVEPAASAGPNEKPLIRPVYLYANSLTPAVRVRCASGKLVFHKVVVDVKGEPSYVPIAATDVPAEGGQFLAILLGSEGQYSLALIPDTGTKGAGGTQRFFNLCPTSIGLDFPGAQQVLPPRGQLLLNQNMIKPQEYGQGRILIHDGEAWQPAGGLRWLQLEDIRTLWFIMPALGQPGHVHIRGIEERIDAPLTVATTSIKGDAKLNSHSEPGATR